MTEDKQLTEENQSKRWTVSAQITISLHTEVEASTEAEALEIAKGRGFCTIGDGELFGDSADDVWLTSGELDGTPFSLTAEETDGDQ